MSFSKRANYIFTSESVAEGHPDKVCDQISDAVLDAYLAANPEARVACETLATTNTIVIAGEVRGADITKAKIEEIARAKVREIGYLQEGFHADNLDVYVHLHSQSADIAVGVDSAADKDEGAGDQGIMFGFACKETASLMPAPIDLSHKILLNLSRARHSGEAKGLGPDAKSQVSLLYDNGKPVRATSIVVSTQHIAGMTQNDVRELVRPYVLSALPDKKWMCDESEFYVNPTGQFVIGGPDGDCGLTGRKIIVDTYGGAAPHGGGAFSGKDPTKVDRSAAYMARYLAKNVVAAGLAERCTIQISYAIGVSKPISFYVNTDGTSIVDEAKIELFLQNAIDLTPRAIRQRLKLNAPIYARTAAYGHFGREPDKNGGFTWEKTDLLEMLQAEFKAAKNAASSANGTH